MNFTADQMPGLRSHCIEGCLLIVTHFALVSHFAWAT